MAYSTEVLADSPVAYWRLAEASGTSAADSAGTITGTYVNAPTLGAASLVASDTANKAVSFDGVNDHVTAPSGAVGLNPTAALTIEAWVKPTTISAGDHQIVRKTGQYFLQRAAGAVSLVVYVAGVAKVLTVTPALVAGTAYHVVATYDGTNQKIYLDGVQVGTRAQTGALSTTANTLYIGSATATTEFWDGTLDEVAIYSTALSAARALAHYEAAAAGVAAEIADASMLIVA